MNPTNTLFLLPWQYAQVSKTRFGSELRVERIFSVSLNCRFLSLVSYAPSGIGVISFQSIHRLCSTCQKMGSTYMRPSGSINKYPW